MECSHPMAICLSLLQFRPEMALSIRMRLLFGLTQHLSIPPQIPWGRLLIQAGAWVTSLDGANLPRPPSAQAHITRVRIFPPSGIRFPLPTSRWGNHPFPRAFIQTQIRTYYSLPQGVSRPKRVPTKRIPTRQIPLDNHKTTGGTAPERISVREPIK